MYLLGIDIGTTKIAGVLLFDDQLIKVLSEDNKAGLKGSHSWEYLQDPEVIVKSVFTIIDKLKGVAERAIASVGISGQMHGFLYVTREGNACSPLFTWQDGRGTIPLELGSAVTAQHLIQEKIGYCVCPGYALVTHYYNYYKGLVPENAYKIISIGGYLAMKLCRSPEACIDPSEAASFGLYDIKDQAFLFNDIRKLWHSNDFLPRLVSFHHQVGTDEEGIPVFQSLGDNQASFYGAMQGQQNANLLLNLGTGGQVSFLLENEKLPEKSLQGMELRPYPSGHLAVGATLSGGKSLELLVEFFAEVLAFFGHKVHKQEIYQVIYDQTCQWNKINDKVFSGQALRVEPYFYGTREQPGIRGAIFNIGAENFRVAPLLYGFIEAMVQELHTLWQTSGLADTKKVYSHIVGSGNAIRRNPIVVQMIEKVFQSRLIISELPEEAACGAAWYAGKSRALL